MINDFIEDIKKLEKELTTQSCNKKEPFIKLGSGKAPILNYNIPQSSCFNTYGHQFVKNISQKAFLPATKEKPFQNYFEVVKKTPEIDLRQQFAEAIQLQRTDDVLLPSSSVLRKHINLQDSDLKAISLGAVLKETDSERKTNLENNDSIPLQKAYVFEKANAINEIQLARLAKKGLKPMIMEKLGGFQVQAKYLTEPVKPTPYFAIMEEYTTCSYLGDYGAGKTLKTFSLLPGEKTTISVRTFKEKNINKEYAENVLDSFSESSTNELEKLIENETGLSSNTTISGSESSSKSKSGNVGGSAGVSLFGIVSIGAKGGYDSGSASSKTNSYSSNRASNVRTVNKALDKHITNSNSNRSIDINTSTSEQESEEQENIKIRELSNINKSRVLNFVFRQLLQQYITITWLSNIKIAYCNGYEESLRVVDLEQLDVLLEDTVNPEMIDDVRRSILKPYCAIFNYQDKPIEFIEKITYKLGECLDLDEQETFWRIRKDMEDSWSATEDGLKIKVPGPILNVSTHTLRTNSVVVDSILGQGEALDCYNMKLQDADAIKSQLENLGILQQMEAIQSIEDPQQRAELYKKVFGNCCDVPQSIIGGCNCSNENTENQ